MIGTPTLTFPVNPERAEIGWRPNPIRHRSPSGREQRLRRRGFWYFRYEWSLLSRAEYSALMALLNRYADETFLLYDIARDQPTGDATPAQMSAPGSGGPNPAKGLQLDGGGQRSRTINLKNAPPSTLCFRQGDLIGFPSTEEMFELAANATSTAGGLLVVTLNQYPRKAPVPAADVNGADDVFVSFVPCRVWLSNVVTADVEGAPPRWGVVAEMIEE